MEDFPDIDELIHDLGLADIPRNAVEDQDIDVRFEDVAVHRRVDLRFPKFHRDLVRDELAFARIIEKRPADFRAGIDRPKHISAGAVKKAGDASEGAALGALAAAGRAEKK